MSQPTASMSSRRKARKRALDVLYEAEVRELLPIEVLPVYLARLDSPRPEYIRYTIELVEGVAANVQRIDELIGSYAEGWTLDRPSR